MALSCAAEVDRGRSVGSEKRIVKRENSVFTSAAAIVGGGIARIGIEKEAIRVWTPRIFVERGACCRLVAVVTPLPAAAPAVVVVDVVVVGALVVLPILAAAVEE